MDGWGCNDWMGWEHSQTLHQDCTQKCCSAAGAGFLLMPHYDICGGGSPTAWCRSGAHPYWIHFLLPATWCWNQQGLEYICLQRLGRLDAGFMDQCVYG